MKNDTRPLMVSIWCITYNHEPYIRQCLEGFVMQKTNFRFEAIVHDDASTDGTAAIVRKFAEKYPDIIKPIFETENQYSKHDGSLERIINEHTHGKYVATCEGDDYWTDPLKLQKQVDYLRSHPGCGLVYTAYRQQNDVTGRSHDIFTSPIIKHDETFKWSLLEQKVMVGTCTTLIESELRRQIFDIKDDFHGFMMGDTQTWFNAARLKGVGYIPEVTGVYRKQETGVTAIFDIERRINFINNCLKLDLHLAYKYGAPKTTVENIKIAFAKTLVSLHIGRKDYHQAEEINNNYMNGNMLVSVYIRLAKIFGMKKLRGLSTIILISKKINI